MKYSRSAYEPSIHNDIQYTFYSNMTGLAHAYRFSVMSALVLFRAPGLLTSWVGNYFLRFPYLGLLAVLSLLLLARPIPIGKSLRGVLVQTSLR